MIFIILIAVTGIPVVQLGQGTDIVRLSQQSGIIVSYLAISAQEVGKKIGQRFHWVSSDNKERVKGITWCTWQISLVMHYKGRLINDNSFRWHASYACQMRQFWSWASVLGGNWTRDSLSRVSQSAETFFLTCLAWSGEDFTWGGKKPDITSRLLPINGNMHTYLK